MPTLLILGASGQIGKEIREQAKSYSFNVLTPTHTKLDITNEEQVKSYFAKHTPHIVINAAGFSKVTSAEEPDNFAHVMGVNGYALKYIASCCSKLDIPLIHISTDLVFDGKNELPYCEKDKPNPVNIYGMSKYLGEKLALKHNKKTIIVRSAWIFGKYSDNFVSNILKIALSTTSNINVLSDWFGSPTPANDLAEVLLNMAKKVLEEPNNKNLYGIFHYSGYPLISHYAFALDIYKEAKKQQVIKNDITITPTTYNIRDTSVKMPIFTFLDCFKLTQIYGIVRKHYRLGLSTYLAQFKDKTCLKVR